MSHQLSLMPISGGGWLVGGSLVVAMWSLCDFLWLLGSVIVACLLRGRPSVALYSEVAPKLFRGPFEVGLNLF